MTREETRSMTLGQFLYYMGDEETFQVCFEGDDWEKYVELTKDNRFLKPFMHCRIACMGAEMLDNENDAAIRISLDDSNMVYL